MLRLAWMGAAPSDGDGVAYAATQLVSGLAARGVEVDCFVSAHESAVPAALADLPGVRFYGRATAWSGDAWYSRTPLSLFVTGQLARAAAQARLGHEALRRHEVRPYDLVYQFSQIELGWLRRLVDRLPPIVIHPEVHAAGELHWARREVALSRRCEPAARRVAVRAMLGVRARVQRSDMRAADLVVAPSRRFAELLVDDYRVPGDRMVSLPNPVDPKRFSPGESLHSPPIRLLFVSRMSVRKGLELVIGLSHRLRDLAGRVTIELIGDRTLWSDYRPLLGELNTDVATYSGPASPLGVAEAYRSAHAVIHPAHYEPFGLTVGEAMAAGLPVVVSSEVGAGEGVDPSCCRVFPAGDEAAFEQTVRLLVADLENGAGPEMRRRARAEAERLFAPDVVAGRLLEALETLVQERGAQPRRTRLPTAAT